jgi:hypothetical protein
MPHEPIRFSIPKPVAAAIEMEALVARVRAKGVIRDALFEWRDRDHTYDVTCSEEFASHILEAVERVFEDREAIQLLCADVIRDLLDRLDQIR